MQQRRSSSLCVDWDLYQNIGLTDAKGKKDIIDNMHEHKVYQQILEQQHLNIIISLSFGNDSGIQPIFLRLRSHQGQIFRYATSFEIQMLLPRRNISNPEFMNRVHTSHHQIIMKYLNCSRASCCCWAAWNLLEQAEDGKIGLSRGMSPKLEVVGS